jgi:hypothetical protein
MVRAPARPPRGDRLADEHARPRRHRPGDRIEADALAIGLLSKRASVLAFINDHFAGYAPETARRLQEALARP